MKNKEGKQKFLLFFTNKVAPSFATEDYTFYTNYEQLNSFIRN